MIKDSVEYFLEKFEKVEAERDLKNRSRRIGSELKFPVVLPDGRAAGIEQTNALWEFLFSKGWEPLVDPLTKEAVGATLQGEMNEHRASCETGFCKVEFSLAHTDNLISLHRSIQEIENLIAEFSDMSGAIFLGYGIQPVTLPGKHLLMKKGRNLFWDRLFGGNEHIRPEDGTDVHLFTLSASNQAHIDVTMDECVDAINVFNGLAGPQIAMTANSNIWKGKVDPEYKCVGEMFWDWWLKDNHHTRYGVPERRFRDLEDYFYSILDFSPVYVKRDGIPVGLPNCRTFSDFYSCRPGDIKCEAGLSNKRRCGLTADGLETEVSSERHDLEQHFTFFWHNARLSRYFTLENRINDQQPPGEFLTVPALTLGIMENLGDASSLVNEYPWDVLRELRPEAARRGLKAEAGGIRVSDISEKIVAIAGDGLKKRGLGEEVFLEPLKERLAEGYCPADVAARILQTEGTEGFVRKFKTGNKTSPSI